jgi:hypothetical protein
MTENALTPLCDELAAFCKANGLPFESADELIFSDGLTAQQKEWLQGYITRWDAEVKIEALRTYHDQNYVKLVGYDGFFAISPDRKYLFECPQLADGTPEPCWMDKTGHLNFGQITAPEDQAFLDAVNRIFGTSFQYDQFAGR